MFTFSSKVREKLKHYVYLYIDPRTDKPFYIGKGKGNRCFSHLKDRSESDKARVIDELRKLGRQPQIEILKYGLTERQALLVEATAIDLLDVKSLTNRMRGHGSRHGARAGVEQIASLLEAVPVEIAEPAVLININRRFRYGMSAQELYDATRSAWKVGPKRQLAEYAFSVYRGVIREAYAIEAWVRGGSTMRGVDESGRPPERPGRWEFVGRVADEKMRRKYVGGSVARHFKKGAQNPIMYVNCDVRRPGRDA